MTSTLQTPPTLGMLDVHTQISLRGAVSNSTTSIDRSGIVNAMLTLLPMILDIWREQTEQVVTEIDDLDPVVLGLKVQEHITAHVELAQPLSELRELSQRFQVLRALRAKKPSKLSRDIDAVVDEFVGATIARLRRSVEKSVALAPHRIKELVENVRAAILGITLPEPNADPITRFGRIVSALSALNQKHVAIPQKTAAFSEQRLSERVLTEYDGAIAALALERVVERLKQEISELHLYLDELLASSSHFNRNIDSIGKHFEDWKTSVLHASEVTRASVVLELTGPTESEVLTGLRTRLGCKDQLALAKLLIAKWEVDLREHSVAWLPGDAPFGSLLTYLDPAVIAESLREIVEASLGEGHSLYEIVERAGIAEIARDLFDRAEHLCHLQSRDNEQFNVNPCSVTIVRFPPAIGPRDVHLRERLAAAFQDLGHCSLVEGSPSERNAITVVRTTVGWPIGIEGGNSGLLQEYARAAGSGHLPHLIGIVSETEHGEAIPAYLELNRMLNTHVHVYKTA